MNYTLNRAVNAVEAPPIAEAMSWISPGPRNRELINLCQAVPSYPPAEALQDELARRVRLPETSLYTDIRGIPELREALSAHIAEDYRGSITPADTLITAGCNQAFCAAINAIAGPGDNLILPSPWYFNHQMWLQMQGLGVKTLPFVTQKADKNIVLAAKNQIDARTRAIILVSPNNPTGTIFTDEEITGLFELAQRHGIALILDETYKDFRPDPGPPHSLFARPDWRGTLIQLYSFSKVFALTGYRAGSIIAGPEVIAEAEKILDCMAICAPRIGQDAALFGLKHLADWKRGKNEMMADRLTALREAFKLPGLNYELVSSGAYFAWVKHPFTGTPSKTVAQKLAREHDLLCLPGSMFGPGNEDHLRIAFANVDASRMAEATARLKESQN